jgi:hypothetical protein
MVTTHAFRTKPLCLEVSNGWLLKSDSPIPNASLAAYLR